MKMNQKDMAGLKKSNKVAIIIMMVLVAAGIILAIVDLINTTVFPFSFLSAVKLMMYLLIAYYGLWGYKKPHGNLLKYLMLVYCFCLLPIIVITTSDIYVILLVITVILISFMAGRLYKFKENRIIAVVVIVLCVSSFIEQIFDPASITAKEVAETGNLMAYFQPLNRIVQWLAICAAYFSRYQLHKEAGLQDKPA